jgi:hypothetical protein
VKVTFRRIDSSEDWEWVIARIPLLLVPDMTSILAVNEKDEILAACVMDTWTETSCQVHFTIENPFVIRHGFLHEISKFVFDDSGRLAMYGLVPADNKKALNLDKKIGFIEITRLKDAYKKGVDYVLLELRKSHCNFNAERGK